MEKKALKKILVIAIVFILTFSNCGYTLQALATSEGLSFWGLNLFGNNMLDVNAYFLDGDGKKQKSNVSDVNGEATLIVELEPKEEGYLKSGTINAIAEEGEVNFEIKEVLTEQLGGEEQLIQVVTPDATLLKTEQVLNVADNIVNNSENSNVAENEEQNTVSNTVDSTIVNETENANNTVATNTVSDNAAQNTTNTVTNTTENTSTEVTNTVQTPTEEQEELVNEDEIANEKIELEKEETEKVANVAQVRIVSGSEIEIENVIEPTKLYVKLQFRQGEKLNVSDIYKQIKLQLSGKYINVDLEEIEVASETELEIGWSYSKDIEVSSEYTKVSPFEVVDTKGTLVENKIVVKREIEDEKYLPLKQTKIEIEVPELNGKKPVAMEVSANKLKATRGEEINEVVFTNENWEYNEETNTLIITVENTDAIYTYGEDIYIVTYRYEDYVQENEINLETKGKVTVEEYSGKENNLISKDLNKEQKIVVNVGELITYSIGTTEEKINKGKINANYNSAEAVYETEFSTTVNINVLTNDVLNEFTLKDTKEFYIDKQNLEFETQDVKYKKIKFKYEEIAELLEKGGSIEIKSNSGELLYTLNSGLIKSQENCEIEIRGEVSGVEISFKNITINGNITVDFVKAIGKCSFDKSAFNSFEKIESRIKAEVKYMSEEAATELTQIKTEKYFEDSFTSAEVELDRDSLSTIENNENVEIKIELNNHLQTSDLFVNPVFEIVFPKYVKNVEAKTTNLLYEDELKVRSTVTYKDEDVVKMQIALEGVQTRFSTGTLTNGTNIIVNANIEVDNYTPKRTDQIRMYYYNEGVTNYESQTKWTVKTDIPTGILKTTNGFDVDVFTFQAPNGFITVNEIENYDGANSSVVSIKQGEETREVAMEKGSQSAKMRLVALNNTENDCTDVMLLGRIPVKNTTDVKTGEDLGNNVDTIITSMIVPADNNPISSTIYYSANPNATKDLKNANNAWTETPADLTQMKSFLIVPMGKVLEGTVFEYTYDFQIPANLPYEAKMYGSFGAFYNNHSDVAVVYETAVADKVGLFTKAGPKVEATMSVDIGDGADVLEGRVLKYTVTVKNTGTMPAQGITVNVARPDYTLFTEYKLRGNIGEGDYAGYYDTNDTEQNLIIDSLEPGEVREVSFLLRVGRPFTKTVSDNEQGNTDENSGIAQNQEYKIVLKADIKVDNLGITSSTNTVNNKIVKAKIISTVFADYLLEVLVGYKFPYIYQIQNTSGEDINNLQVVCKLPNEFKYEKYSVSLNDVECIESFDEQSNTLTVTIPKLATDQDAVLYVYVEAVNGALETVTPELTYKFEDGTSEVGPTLPTEIKGAVLKTELVNQTDSSTVLEGDTVEYKVRVSNIGKYDAGKVEVNVNVSENIENVKVYYISISDGIVTSVPQDGVAKLLIPLLRPEQNIDIIIEGEAKDLDGLTNNKIKNTIIIKYIDIERNRIETNEIVIKENPTKDELKDDYNGEAPENDNISDDYVDDTNNEINQDDSNHDNNSNNSTNNNDSNLNIDNEQNNNENTNNDEDNSTNDNGIETPTATYSISGCAWLDENKNGQKDDSEKDLTSVEVQLLKGENVIKVTQTNINGKYTFSDVANGTYSIRFVYDVDKYIATTYNKEGVDNSVNSDAVQMSNGYAVSNNLIVNGTNIENINIGLQNKDILDFTIEKVITSAKVTTKKGETVHEFDNLELAKVEIAAKELKNSTVELSYKINITNKGNAEGQVTQIVDYIPKDSTVNTEINKGWYLGNDGNAYNESLKEINIMPGETKTLHITITRTMTEENTGVVENKIGIMSTYNKLTITENVENNMATQETIISIKTGYAAQITVLIVFIVAISIISNLVITKKIKIDLKNFKINKIYK